MSILSKIIKKKEKTRKKEKIPSENRQTLVEPERPRPRILPRVNTLILHRPWITEKSTELSKAGKYIFIVDKKANKPEIKKAIEAVYNVNVVSMRIANIPPRQRRLGQTKGIKSGFKKAIATLKEGEAIDIMPH